ncbi:hypothetical protein LCGC14_2738610 [marine sediment metagenome]|uniref:Uncharacterized protein n=1 Tax=marine sediment metagenome TaxID=412755 RepID=A0A0F8ZSG5_9ZZZZ
MEQKVTINDKEYTVKEIPYIDAVDTDPNEGRKAMVSKALMLSVGLTQEEINALTMKEGLTLQKVIDEVNGLVDFQKAAEKNK